MRFLDTSLLVEPLNDGIHWAVRSPFSYAVGSPTGSTVICVPVGFITDFASTPRFLWSIVPPTGRYSKAVLLHDYLYATGRIGELIIDRAYADGVLAEACRVLAANEMLTYGATHTELSDYLDRAILYRGVRFGGWVSWNKYRHQQALQEGTP